MCCEELFDETLNHMDQEKAHSILSALADGIDPITGEVLPNDSPYNQPDVIRALFHVLKVQVSPTGSKKKSLEERQQDNIAKGKPINYGLPWTDDCLQDIKQKHGNGISIDEIASQVGRQPRAVISIMLKKGFIAEEEAIKLGLTYNR